MGRPLPDASSRSRCGVDPSPRFMSCSMYTTIPYHTDMHVACPVSSDSDNTDGLRSARKSMGERKEKENQHTTRFLLYYTKAGGREPVVSRDM